KLPVFICNALYVLIPTQSKAANQKDEKPNILWLTFEDTSAGEFGCYGNKDVHTPNTDSLAANGIQFMNAWSVAPQSSAARSSLITGCYSTTYGMDVHPVPYDTPDNIFFPQKLRECGYYCTNNSKTHYNSTRNNKACWDECNKKASYNSSLRKEGQPFFAVFNTVTSHMGRVRTFHTDGRRDFTKEGIYPTLLTLPGYVPDLPAVRSDYAGHLEAVQDVDTWLGFFLKDLKEKGLDENTIIFFFSDHGGCIPRGKGYLYESGLKVPLIIYFPEKWKHLAQHLSKQENSLVNFTDLGPTVLSIAGIKPPKNMQGKALAGKHRNTEIREKQFALATNQLHHFMPVRAVTDGRYKYIRSYIPYRQFALRNYYQWGMPSNQAWDEWVLGGHNTCAEWEQTFHTHPAEMLFDLKNDPDELHNLSTDANHADILADMRNALSEHIRSTQDLGFFLPNSREGHILYETVRKEKYPLNQLYELVETAGTATPEALP
ncbi:sulfatase AtsG, partial [gut metagenome]